MPQQPRLLLCLILSSQSLRSSDKPDHAAELDEDTQSLSCEDTSVCLRMSTAAGVTDVLCVCVLSADVLDFSEEALRVVAGAPRRPPLGKAAEKNPDSFRRIFSAHKKVRDMRAGSDTGPRCHVTPQHTH